jgi:hypothetical protein
VITVGIDLAAQPKNTALACLEWEGDRCRVTDLHARCCDDELLAAIRGASKAGLDCPVGWPDAFVEFLLTHRDGHVAMAQGVGSQVWRRGLANRATDTAVHANHDLKLTPLSVATDRIAHPAMRAAALLAQLAAEGRPVDRTGVGVLVEVYPAASLKLWGLDHRGYKGSTRRATLVALAEALATKCRPWLYLGEYRDAFSTSDHCFDAVVAALSARAAATGRVLPMPPEHAAAAAREGWIALPTRDSLTELHRDASA